MQAHIDKINEMASVMKKAIEVDEGHLCEDEERIKQLEVKQMHIFCYQHFINLFPLYVKKKKRNSDLFHSFILKALLSAAYITSLKIL